MGSGGARGSARGVSGNLWDRVRDGAVLDFIDLRIWPAFNLADLAIVVGASAALFELLTSG